MTPILQRPIALAARVPLGCLLLCQMPLAIRNHAPHVVNVCIGVVSGLSGWVVLQDFDNSATAMSLLSPRYHAC